MRASRWVIAISTVVVLAAAGGALVANKQRPVDTSLTNAAPLRNDTIAIRLDLAKLPVGRGPQVAYLTGRVLKGGAGGEIVIPGQQKILHTVRYLGSALIVLRTGTAGSELARIDSDEGFRPERVPDVRSLVGSLEQDTAAYATVRSTARGGRVKGSTVFWLGGGTEQVRQLKRPNDWGSTVLAVVGDAVYFAAATGPGSEAGTLNSWDSATGKVTRLHSIGDPLRTDHQGRLVVSRDPPRVMGSSCPYVVDIAAGRRLWWSCDYVPAGFTVDGKTVIGIDSTKEITGGEVAALDARTGEVKRAWTGVRFYPGVAEDDDHLLFYADANRGTLGAIIRCSVETGRCELATALAAGPLVIAS